MLRVYIGRHLSDLFQVLFPEFTPEQVEELRLRYRAHYLARNHGGTTLYPGVMEALEALEGAKATATTKSTPTTRDVLRRFGLLPHFQHVQGTDGFPAKPEPDVVLRAMEALDARPENCLMVGDAPADICAGRRAGVKTCAVRYGYGMRNRTRRSESRLLDRRSAPVAVSITAGAWPSTAGCSRPSRATRWQEIGPLRAGPCPPTQIR